MGRLCSSTKNEWVLERFGLKCPGQSSAMTPCACIWFGQSNELSTWFPMYNARLNNKINSLLDPEWWYAVAALTIGTFGNRSYSGKKGVTSQKQSKRLGHTESWTGEKSIGMRGQVSTTLHTTTMHWDSMMFDLGRLPRIIELLTQLNLRRWWPLMTIMMRTRSKLIVDIVWWGGIPTSIVVVIQEWGRGCSSSVSATQHCTCLAFFLFVPNNVRPTVVLWRTICAIPQWYKSQGGLFDSFLNPGCHQSYLLWLHTNYFSFCDHLCGHYHPCHTHQLRQQSLCNNCLAFCPLIDPGWIAVTHELCASIKIGFKGLSANGWLNKCQLYAFIMYGVF